MRISATRQRTPAFTLIEVLVSIAIIAILLSLAIPALSSAKTSANSMLCLTRLRSAHQAQMLYANTYEGVWPNGFSPRTTLGVWVVGCTQWESNYTMDQAWMWSFMLHDAGIVNQEKGAFDVEGISCPVIWKEQSERQLETNAWFAARQSYAYSAGLFTDPALWDPAFPQRRANPDKFRKTISVSRVAFPGNKVSLFEFADHHKSRLLIGGSTGVSVNAGFADGHADHVNADDATEPLSYTWPTPQFGPGYLEKTPFLTTAMGAQGHDFD